MALHRKAAETQRRHWSLNRTSYKLIQFLRPTLVAAFINTNNVVWDSLHLFVKWGLIILNSLGGGGVTSLPLGSTVVGLPHFSLWTSVFCSISSADDGRVILLWLGPRVSFVRAGEDGVWIGDVTERTSLLLATHEQHPGLCLLMMSFWQWSVCRYVQARGLPLTANWLLYVSRKLMFSNLHFAPPLPFQSVFTRLQGWW